MYCVEIEITPELARKWLEKNTNNRVIKWEWVHTYAETFKRGLWQENPEMISFYQNGNLRNGQHRLLGIIEAGVPVKMWVAFDVPNDSVICDNNRPRTLQNFCQISGEEDALCSKDVTSGVNTLFAQYHRHAVSDAIKLKFIEDNASVLLYIKRETGRRHNRLASRAAVFAALFVAYSCGIDESTIERFISALTSGFVNNDTENAAIVLRNTMLNEKSGGRTNAEKTFQTALKAISDFENGVPRKRGYSKLTTESLPFYNSYKETIQTYI